MEFKETEFGTEIIGLDKELRQVGREGLLGLEVERLRARITEPEARLRTYRNANKAFAKLVFEVEAKNKSLRNVIQKVLTYNQGGAWGEDLSPDEFMKGRAAAGGLDATTQPISK